MFKSNIANKVSTMFEIYIPQYECPDISFGIYSSDIVNEVFEEVKEYIAKNLEMKKFSETNNSNIISTAEIMIHGKALVVDDFYNDELISKVDAKYEELFRNQFGNISDDEFEERISALNSYEYFADNVVPMIREIKIFERN